MSDYSDLCEYKLYFSYSVTHLLDYFRFWFKKSEFYCLFQDSYLFDCCSIVKYVWHQGIFMFFCYISFASWGLVSPILSGLIFFFLSSKSGLASDQICVFFPFLPLYGYNSHLHLWSDLPLCMPSPIINICIRYTSNVCTSKFFLFKKLQVSA